MNERVVSAEWLADRLDDVRVVDVRDGWEFGGIGHVPGAVNVPFESFRAEEHGLAEAGRLPGAAVFSSRLGDVGITHDDHLVAYDDTHGVFAARFLVTAELYGHDPDRLHLLNGDFSSWQLEHETSAEQTTVSETTYPAAYDEDGPLVGTDAVRAALDDETVVVDVRASWEYDDGHLPGAVRLDWRELVDDDTRGLLSERELRTRLETRGIVPDRPVCLYCNTARRISHTYVVLCALGYDDVAFYEGSLTEWLAAGGELV